MRLTIFLTAFALLAFTTGCNTADLSYPPITDSGNLTDVQNNDACLDRCNGFDSGAEAATDAADAADSATSADSASEAATDAGDGGG